MKIRKGLFTWIGGFVFSVFIFSGCAGPSVYSVHMSYDAGKVSVPANLKGNEASNDTIGVAEFTDTRKIEDHDVIGRVVERDGMKKLVFPKNIRVTKAISQGIKEYLRKAGYKVDDKNIEWDLKDNSIPKSENKILIGGSIDQLEVICIRNFPTNSYKIDMKLTIYFADTIKGNVLYRSTVESSYAKEHIWFSEGVFGDQASIALGDVIEKLFEDETVAQKFKEAMAP